MKPRILRTILAALLLLSTFNLQLSTLFAQGTAFAYQGRLNDGPAPANGLYDLTFSVFSLPNGGSPVAGSLTNSAVAVSNGLFTTLLDFGPDLFDGPGPVLLEIAVRPSGGGTFSTLSPRQLVTPAPHAITSSLAFQAVNALNVANGAAVTRLNNLSDNVTLAAGANVTITPSGNTLTIGASGINPWQLNGTNTFYNSGRVGIGTTTPSTPLHIAANVDPVLVIQDTGPSQTQAGYVGFWNGTRTETGWIGFGSATDSHFSVFNARPDGNIRFFTASGERVTIVPSGNVGIGTTTPQGRLEVRGDIRLGPSGEFRATSGEENLRIVRGIISENGTILRGSGFTVVRTPGFGSGRFTITFTPTPFASPPTVCATADYDASGPMWLAMANNVTASNAEIVLFAVVSGTSRDIPFHFIAIGPR